MIVGVGVNRDRFVVVVVVVMGVVFDLFRLKEGILILKLGIGRVGNGSGY